MRDRPKVDRFGGEQRVVFGLRYVQLVNEQLEEVGRWLAEERGASAY